MAQKVHQHTVRFEPEVWAAIRDHAKRHHQSYSMAVNNATKQALFPEYQEEHNAALMAGLDRIEYQLKALRSHQRDDATLLKEMLGTFVRVWFNSTAPVPEEHRSSAARSGAARFERFLDLVVDQLDRRQSVLDRVPKATRFNADDYPESPSKEPIDEGTRTDDGA